MGKFCIASSIRLRPGKRLLGTREERDVAVRRKCSLHTEPQTKGLSSGRETQPFNQVR